MAKTLLLVAVAFLLSGPLLAAGPEGGVNIISVGNRYNDPQFQNKPLDQLFTALKDRGVLRISLRVTWSAMENQDGSLNQAYLAALRRIYDRAQMHGFKAMLDFHTLFATNSYACPKWVSDYPQDDGSPGVRSIGMIARSQAVRQRYLAYVAGVVTALKDCPAIDVVSVMNEPFPFGAAWSKSSRWNAEIDRIQGVIEAAAAIVREKAPGKRVAVRFGEAVNPWNHDPKRRFDTRRMLVALDIIGQNVYLNPDRARGPERGDSRPTFSWDVCAEAAAQCRKAGKAFWITEFGAPWHGARKGVKCSPESQAERFEGFCRRFWGDDIQPQAVLAWVLAPNPKSVDTCGLYDGATGEFRPAFAVYARYMLGSDVK